MHERYFFFAEIMFVIFAFYYTNRFWVVFVSQFCSIEGLIIFLALITLRLVWKKAPAGTFSAIFCLMYACARIYTECYREPDAPLWGSITRGQYLSFAIIALGLVFLYCALRKRKNADSHA